MRAYGSESECSGVSFFPPLDFVFLSQRAILSANSVSSVLKRLPCLKFGSCGTMTLQGFSFGSAAEILDDDAGEEGYGVEVGFGFGDGYDLGASTREASDFKSASHEAVA